jgi:hypothetical protein
MLNLKIKVMKLTNLIFAASLIVFATSFSACQKTETVDPIAEAVVEDDQSTALFDNVQAEADEVATLPTPAKSSAEFSAMTSGSGSRTIVLSFPGGDTTVVRTITYVNFINPNAVNGHVKNGTIIVKVIGGPTQATFVKITTLQDFSIDGIKIEGKRVVTKTADHQFNDVLTGGKITFTDNTFITREANHTRTWTVGYDTPLDITDDTFTIEGTASGTNRKGKTYTRTILNPLVIESTCRWIVEGTIEIVSESKTAELDYGMGTCDDIATLTVNGKTYDIKLRTKR